MKNTNNIGKIVLFLLSVTIIVYLGVSPNMALGNLNNTFFSGSYTSTLYNWGSFGNNWYNNLFVQDKDEDPFSSLKNLFAPAKNLFDLPTVQSYQQPSQQQSQQIIKPSPPSSSDKKLYDDWQYDPGQSSVYGYQPSLSGLSPSPVAYPSQSFGISNYGTYLPFTSGGSSWGISSNNQLLGFGSLGGAAGGSVSNTFGSTSYATSLSGTVGMSSAYKASQTATYSNVSSLSTGGVGTSSYSSSYPSSSGSSYESADTIGYSTGGAKDVNNFRENIKEDYLPMDSDITYEGLFYNYYFDTGQSGICRKLFCPSYSMAVTDDPFSGKVEYYMSVGLNSGLKERDFQRKNLNLVIVLDISGSMGSAFDRYYYDSFGNIHELKGLEYTRKKKMDVAIDAIIALLDHLGPDDRFGMVLFESEGHLAKPLNLVGDTDMNAIRGHIRDLTERGSTDMSAGLRIGTGLFDPYLDINQNLYENRMIFLTDAMPNTGKISDTELLYMLKRNANNTIHTTVIGIGIDFNSELIEEITKVRGANYYSVHSSNEFEERMDEGFEYMVTPLVFDLELSMDAPGYSIEKVYGSPEADEATGRLMKINTLFPSKQTEEGIKGGVVVLKLKKLRSDARINLSVSYVDRQGIFDESTEVVGFGSYEPEYFANTGIRKAILLVRYANLIKNWIIDERSCLANSCLKLDEPLVDYERGICLPPLHYSLGKWERQSVDLYVSPMYRQLFREFKTYFQSEMDDIGDYTLAQEITILEILSSNY